MALSVADVRLWHLADISLCAAHVLLLTQSGHQTTFPSAALTQYDGASLGVEHEAA